ncbi:MAG: alpha-2-macroglobulin family protein [Pirellulales bacterium]
MELTMPENLTAWKIKVWGMGHGTKVGQADAEVVTAKDVIVRLQAPRFFVEKDEVVLSANVHNYLKTAKDVVVKLDLDGGNLELLETEGSKNRNGAERTIKIPAGGEQRVDWRVKVVREGEALVRMSARTDEDSDAMEQKFPVYVHGMLKTDSFSGMLRVKDTAGKLDFAVPRNVASSNRGSRFATRRPWPARASTRCRTWPTIRTAAPSRRSIASCRPWSRKKSCNGWAST